MRARGTAAAALVGAMAVAGLLAPAQPALSEAPAVRVSANYRLGDDLHPVRGHDLPVIKADPADPRHVVEFDFDYVNESCDANVSFDAGATWTGSVLSGPAGFKAPYCHINNNHRGGRPAHASIGFGSPGRVYTTFASENTDGSDSIGVLTSTDGGRSFAPSVLAMPAIHPDATTPGTDYRRPQLAVAPASGGDKIYVAGWNCSLDAQFGRCASVAFAASSDGARTFGAPTTVNPPSALDQDFDNSQPVVSANIISVAYRHGHRTNPEEPDFNKARFDTSLVLGTSTDGGATWSTSTIRPSFTPARGFVDPMLAADPRDGTLYVTYEEKVDQITLPPPQQPQPIADIFVQHSSDGGRTWSAPIRVNDDPMGAKINHWQPWLSVGGDGAVNVTWFDQRNAYPEAKLQDVYYASSAGRDAPFSANRRITDRINNRDLGYTGPLGTFPPVNTPVDGGVLVAWGETREGNYDTNNQDIYLARVDPHATPKPPVRTLAATNLSVGMSKLAYPGGSDYVAGKTVTKVVVVNESDGPAALAAAVLARANYGPVLTSPKTQLSKAVKDEITRLKPTGAYVIGDETKLSAAVASTLGDSLGKAPVDRLAGTDPPDTARLIAQAMDTRTDADKTAAKPAFPAAVVVNPTSSDAAGGAEVAASLKLPLLFSDANAVPAATTDALNALSIPKTIVVGQTTVISAAVMGSLPAAERATPTELTAKAEAVAGVAPVRPPANVVYVAGSEHPVEAGVLAAAASRLGGTLLVVPGGTATAATNALSPAELASVDRMVVIGHSTSRRWPWPVLIVVGLLAIVGTVLLVLTRRRRKAAGASPAGE